MDGALASFPSTGFVPATKVVGRTTEGIDWIANNSTGSNGNLTFFVFRQVFDLTGIDPATVLLSFRWAADDSGQGILSRGSWVPKYRLNGGPLITSIWPGGESYVFGPTVTFQSGFNAGRNSLEFFVQGNGGTDGMALTPVSLKGTPSVPEPSTLVGFALGILGLGVRVRRNLLMGFRSTSVSMANAECVARPA